MFFIFNLATLRLFTSIIIYFKIYDFFVLENDIVIPSQINILIKYLHLSLIYTNNSFDVQCLLFHIIVCMKVILLWNAYSVFIFNDKTLHK